MKFLKSLEEMHGGVHGLDNYDRAVDMINAAVEHHQRNDSFDRIADIEGLIQFLQSQHHDFTPALEQTVRDIIADELGGREEEEEQRWKAHAKRKAKRTFDERPRKPSRDFYTPSRRDRHHDVLSRAARHEEEESSADLYKRDKEAWWKEHERRKQARKYGVSGPSRRARGVRRRDPGRPRGTFGLEQEEIRRLSKSELDRVNTSRRPPRPRTTGQDVRDFWDFDTNEYSDLDSARARKSKRFDANRRSMMRLRHEQEEETDWNKEVERFRKRRKKYEPEAARSGRIRDRVVGRRRMAAPSSSVMGLRFESFKGFLSKDETSSDK